jgi:hypothetical protein
VRHRCPDQLEAIGTTAEGRQIAEGYRAKSRGELCHGEMSDLMLANAIYMASRNDLELIATRPPVPDKQLTDVVERLKNSLTCKGARLNDGDWTTLQARDVRAIIDAMDAISRCGISASDQAASA